MQIVRHAGPIRHGPGIVMGSGPADDPVPLASQLLDYYREMVSMHAEDPIPGVCSVCLVPRCEDWRFATERLMCAGDHRTREGPAIAVAPSPLDGAR